MIVSNEVNGNRVVNNEWSLFHVLIYLPHSKSSNKINKVLTCNSKISQQQKLVPLQLNACLFHFLLLTIVAYGASYLNTAAHNSYQTRSK